MHGRREYHKLCAKNRFWLCRARFAQQPIHDKSSDLTFFLFADVTAFTKSYCIGEINKFFLCLALFAWYVKIFLFHSVTNLHVAQSFFRSALFCWQILHWACMAYLKIWPSVEIFDPNPSGIKHSFSLPPNSWVTSV